MQQNIRVRIGPSPTGEPHVGTAYIALFNLAFAKKHHGKFVLRIEDTDQTRSRREYETQIIEGLKWLGLEWDEGPDKGGPFGPYRQSERTEIYRREVQNLIDKKEAYRCFCSKERLDAVREKQKAEKSEFIGYDRHCRSLSESEIQTCLEKKEPFVVRMKVPTDGQTVFFDRLRKEVTIENRELDDQIIQKVDGFPTYHLASVVDDHHMQITHVIRAEEWISSTPKHVILYRAFGWNPPEFVHMPLLRNKDKSKISKRKNPVSVLDYRKRGFLPEAVKNYLSMLGFSMPNEQEVFTFDEFSKALDFDRISLGGPVFDLEKLTWLNGRYFREILSEEELVQFIHNQVLSEDYIRKIIPHLKERIEIGEQFIENGDYFFRGSLGYSPEDLIPNKMDKDTTIKMLEQYLEQFETFQSFEPTALETFSREVAEKINVKTKDLFMSLRIAFTGRKASPPLFDTCVVLGQPLSRRRLRDAIEKLKTARPARDAQ